MVVELTLLVADVRPEATVVLRKEVATVVEALRTVVPVVVVVELIPAVVVAFWASAWVEKSPTNARMARSARKVLGPVFMAEFISSGPEVEFELVEEEAEALVAAAVFAGMSFPG